MHEGAHFSTFQQLCLRLQFMCWPTNWFVWVLHNNCSKVFQVVLIHSSSSPIALFEFLIPANLFEFFVYIASFEVSHSNCFVQVLHSNHFVQALRFNCFIQGLSFWLLCSSSLFKLQTVLRYFEVVIPTASSKYKSLFNEFIIIRHNIYTSTEYLWEFLIWLFSWLLMIRPKFEYFHKSFRYDWFGMTS